MPRRCLVCLSPDRASVDNELVGGTPFRNVSKRHGLSVASLFRHRKEHISAALVKAAERREENLGDSLFGEMRTLQARTLKLLDDAEKDEDGRLRAAAIHQSRENLALLSKLLSDLRGVEGGRRVATVSAEPMSVEEWTARSLSEAGPK